MPGMTGLEMLPKVKAERPNVPVIMITAYGDEATRKRATELGRPDYFPSPRGALIHVRSGGRDAVHAGSLPRGTAPCRCARALAHYAQKRTSGPALQHAALGQ